MNLGRAKSILIIAFAGLNIFLGYYLFWPDFGRLTKVAITAEDLQITESMLSDSNYILEVSLDRSARVSDFITVSMAMDFQRKILQHFIEKGASASESGNTSNFQAEGETAIIYSNGLIQIVYDPGIFLAEDAVKLEEREIKRMIKQFLENEKLLPDGIHFDYMELIEDGVNFYYYQILEDAPIYASQLKVVLESDYIKLVEIYWLSPTKRTPPREMEVISATKALTNMINELGPSPEPRQIQHIELGYYSGEYDAEKWEIPPVWRIALDGKEYYYINAFTGNLEHNSVILD
ncbi:MAG: two-component system regulatory protein YycI [Bacillota bacterium]